MDCENESRMFPVHDVSQEDEHSMLDFRLDSASFVYTCQLSFIVLERLLRTYIKSCKVIDSR